MALLRTSIALGLVLLGLAVISGLIKLEAEELPFYLTLLAFALVVGSAEIRQSRSNVVAVTDQRLIRVDTAGDRLKYREVDLKDVGKVEVLPRLIRVTKTNGQVVEFGHAGYAPEFGLAAAQASGRPLPWTPEPLDKGAIYLNLCAGAAAYMGTIAVITRGLSAAGLIPIPFPQCLLLLVPILLIALAAWLAAEALGLIVLRTFRTPGQLRSWISYYAEGQRDAEHSHSGPPNIFIRIRMRYLNLVADLLDRRQLSPASTED